MKSIIITILVITFIVFSSLQALAEEWTAEQKEVWKVIDNNWMSAKTADGNEDVLLEGLHDSFICLYGDKYMLFDKSQVITQNKVWKPTHIELKPLAINIVMNVANVFYMYKWEDEKNGWSQRGRRMETLIKQNDRWLSIGNSSSLCDETSYCPSWW
jgi:hypothetical protein